MSEEIKDEDIKVSEEKDGSATVEVPESLMPAEEGQDDQPQNDKAEASTDDSDEDHPDDTDAVREARRARRKAKKEYIKRTNQEKDQRLAMLDRQNKELMARLAAVEKRTHMQDLASIDKAISDENSRLNYAKMKMKEAADNSDGQALIKAKELWDEVKDRIEKLQAYKKHAEVVPEPPADPVIKELAEEWMERNPWYDPDLSDRDSKIAKRIDNQLVKEGWDPGTEDYWEELDARLQKQISRQYTDRNDETPRKRGPKSVVTGSERETGGGGSRNTFTLSPEQVRAIKEAGMWDDPKKRNRMIQKYAEYARSNRS